MKIWMEIVKLSNIFLSILYIYLCIYIFFLRKRKHFKQNIFQSSKQIDVKHSHLKPNSTID
jgi:hypothetical protein